MRTLVLVSLALLLAAPRVSAQQPAPAARPTVDLAVGAVQFDLSGVGTDIGTWFLD